MSRGSQLDHSFVASAVQAIAEPRGPVSTPGVDSARKGSSPSGLVLAGLDSARMDMSLLASGGQGAKHAIGAGSAEEGSTAGAASGSGHVEVRALQDEFEAVADSAGTHPATGSATGPPLPANDAPRRPRRGGRRYRAAQGGCTASGGDPV